MPRNYYVSGGWNVICDSCGKKIKASEAKQRWDGLIVCPNDFEMRQPQDFVKARADKITVPFTRPRPTDDFILTQGFFDGVTIMDDCDVVDYIDPLSGYFLQDYMVDNCSVTIVTLWQRPFTDAVNNLEESIHAAINRGAITDTFTLSETVNVVRRFVRTFNDSTTITESQANKLVKALSDDTTAVDNYSRTVKYARTINDPISAPTDTLSFVTKPSLSDSVTLNESFNAVTKFIESMFDTINAIDSGGSIFNADYIDATYFASNTYVGSTYTF